MSYTHIYAESEPARDDIDALTTPTVIEFGAPWCGHCLAAQPLLAAAMSAQPRVAHFKIEDGKGRRLGRSFKVKLWPTLIFLDQGQEITRLVRPTEVQAILDALAQIDRSTSGMSQHIASDS